MEPLQRYHPEVAVGGYTAVDGTVEFYLRVKTLLEPGQIILDLGAGRAAWMDSPTLPGVLRELLDLRGASRRLIGLDVDPVVLNNSLLDEAYVLSDSTSKFPMDDQSVDLVLSDWTFEHLTDPEFTAREIARVLKPGGWLCARTPNKNGYVSIANRVIPTKFHHKVLERGQPGRLTEDIFPTVYRMNTIKQVADILSGHFDVTTYTSNPEPAYLGTSKIAWAALKFAERLAPRRYAAVLLIFAQRRSDL